VDRVLTGQLDAVTTDNSILYGYAAQHPGKLKVLNSPFSEEKYGIGLKKDDKKGRDAVNDALAKMVSDGSWAIALKSNLSESGFRVPRLERY
jgi:glutamate transport system substrate-binding protein